MEGYAEAYGKNGVKMKSDMVIVFNPEKSSLGVETVKHEIVKNATGVLAVTFRYRPELMSNFTDGLQMQFETINAGASRGGHYHYPENACERFYLLKGNFDLIVCDIYNVSVKPRQNWL